MLDIHSQWPEGGIGVEAGLVELYRLMELGKFKVFKHLIPWFDEKMSYHRDENGKIVKINDDLLSATRYAYMMRRFAIQAREIGSFEDDEFEEFIEHNEITGY